MATVKIQGYSDDIVGVEGTGMNDEFDAIRGFATLNFSDGTVLSVDRRTDGIWRINRVKAGMATYLHCMKVRWRITPTLPN